MPDNDGVTMETEVLGQDDRAVGVEVHDDRGNRHIVNVEWDGGIEEHIHQDVDYPNDPEERTVAEQRLVEQVEHRARYAAQRAFPDADLLDPMWDPEHVAAGLAALRRYPEDAFGRQFRDFYEALSDPRQFLQPTDADLDSVRVRKAFRVENRAIVDVAPVVVRECDPGPVEDPQDDYPPDQRIVCRLPPLEFADGYEYQTQFPDLVVGHLTAQIRDVYRSMRAAPPERYDIDGLGKVDGHPESDDGVVATGPT